MRKLLIWGASGHARVVAEIIRMNNEVDIIGFVDDTVRAQNRFLDLPVYHSLEEVRKIDGDKTVGMIVAVGDCTARMRIAESAVTQGFTLVSAIHPRSTVSPDAHIGDGTVIAAGAIVNTGCSIGANVIVNTGATVDHDCRIADGVHIGPGVHIGGWTTVGSGTWLGIGAILKDRVTIGSGSIIGAGAVVLSDVPKDVVAWGVPAQVVKQA